LFIGGEIVKMTVIVTAVADVIEMDRKLPKKSS
jgi:hypothetical protein